MVKKSTGLAGWTQPQQPAVAPSETVAAGSQPLAAARSRGKGATVAITVRLKREQWERLHDFALHEGDSLQGLALRGLNGLLKERGLPPL
jgi:hypothetical protein